MQFVRAATIEEVLRATPEDEPSMDIVRACAAFGVWAFGREDIGNIGAQLPAGKVGTIASLFAEWKGWLRSDDPRAVWNAAVHAACVQVLREGQTFAGLPIVLGSPMHILDGRHRLFATFELLETDARDRSFEVFWDRVVSTRASQPPTR